MIRIGILGGADIAFRMFIPAAKKIKEVEFIGVASNNKERRDKFKNEYNVEVYNSYQDIIEDKNIDAVYIPLPPALHYKWAKIALEHGKHVLLEKPSTTDYKLSKELVDIADKNDLVIQENYMFQYHSQLKNIIDIVSSGRIGKVRLVKSSFGFPKRSENDFRYNKELGGGALMDVGGYITKLATLLLGKTIKVSNAEEQFDRDYGVDIFGSVSFTNNDGVIFQGSFGMDCHYQCNLELWGSQGKLVTNRIFTAPPGFIPKLTIEDKNGSENIELEEDNHFKKSIEHFINAIKNEEEKRRMKSDLLLQSKLISEIKMKMRNINE